MATEDDPAKPDAPPASSLPPGTTVLAADGTDRSNLRDGAAATAALIFLGGFLFGRITKGRR